MMKKSIALLLCLVLVLGCFAGCGKAEKEPEQAPETAAPAEPEKTEKPAEPETPAQPEEIKVEPGTLPLVPAGEEAVIKIGVCQNNNTENYDTNAYTLWLEEQTGIDLQFVYFAQDKAEALTQLNLMIAGGEELPDILWGHMLGSSLISELGQDGYLLDLSDYFDEYGYYFWEAYNQVKEGEREQIFQFGKDPTTGAMYAFPHYTESVGDACGTFAVINAAWLEAVGAEMPTTVDELYEVLKKFVEEDPNGNGQKDEIGVVGKDYAGWRTDILEYLINAFVYCNDEYVFNATDGKIWIPYNTDEYRQALITMNKWYQEGLISPLFYSIAEDSELTNVVTPVDGVALSGVAGAHTSLNFEKDSPVLYEYAALPPLKAATDLGGYAVSMGSSYYYQNFITADCDDPVLAFRLLDFMTSQESYLRMRYGIPGEDWNWAAEGATNAYGVPAVIDIVDSSIFSSQNNKCWHETHAIIVPTSMSASSYVDDGSWGSARSKLAADIKLSQVAVGTPAEVVFKLIYTTEEQEVASAVETSLKDYIAEARAMFVSGVMDPNNDTEWETYLSNLEAQGMNDWLAVAQSAYTRMTAG